MAKYQMGSGIVAARERIILYTHETYVDLLAVLHNDSLRKALLWEESEIPTSLLQIVQKWSFWQEKLPHLVDAWFTQREQIGGELRREEIQWLPPLMYPDKLICIGANYNDHAVEMGGTVHLRNPYSFLKSPRTTLIGSGETFTLPGYAKLIDWEAELAIIIGKRIHNVSGEEAMASIAGYSVINDLTAHDWMAPDKVPALGHDWVMDKSFDKAAPMGPFITPADFVEDPQQLIIKLSVNEQQKQHACTASMIFSVQEIVKHLATVMTLEPGDVIATGSPSGVGARRNPPEFLRSGDIVVAEIEGLGQLKTPVE